MPKKISPELRAAREAAKVQVRREREEKLRLKKERMERGISVQALAWPPDVPRTPKEARRHGRFHVKNVDDIFLSIQKTAVAMELDYCVVGWGVSKYAVEMATSEDFSEPGVMILYGGNQGKSDEWHRRLPMDKWRTAAANLRAASNGLKGLNQIIKAGVEEWVQSLDRAMLSVIEKPKAPDKSKMPVNNLIDCMRVLEIHQDTISAVELRAQYKSLLLTYHPDKMNGEHGSYLVIRKAYDFWMAKLEEAIKPLAPVAPAPAPEPVKPEPPVVVKPVVKVTVTAKKKKIKATPPIIKKRRQPADAVDKEVERAMSSQ